MTHPRPAWLLLLLAALGSGCSPWRPPASQPTAPSAVPAASTSSATAAAGAPATASAEGGQRPAARPAPPTAAARKPLRPARHWQDFQMQAAERLVEANPGGTYLGPVPEPLLAIPVLEIELNADGSVRRITVKRKPGQALDTVQLAIAAVERAAPFGPVGHLPRPWKFTEVFLFNNQRLFKPRTLDL